MGLILDNLVGVIHHGKRRKQSGNLLQSIILPDLSRHTTSQSPYTEYLNSPSLCTCLLCFPENSSSDTMIVSLVIIRSDTQIIVEFRCENKLWFLSLDFEHFIWIIKLPIKCFTKKGGVKTHHTTREPQIPKWFETEFVAQ